jgi:hypothetical protein
VCPGDNANTNTYAVDTGIAYPDTFSYAYCYDSTITDAYAYRNRFTDAYTNSDGATQGNTKASSDSASSAVREAVISEK